MIKLILFLTSLALINASYVTKISSELTVSDLELPRGENLNVEGFKKTKKPSIFHITLRNCSGVIDLKTFQHFSKLKTLTIWRSNIEELSATLPITHLTVIGSRFPNLDENLRNALPNLESLVLLGNKNFEVDHTALKTFKQIKVLQISEANFSSDCVTKEWFKGMTSLQELSLSNNGLSCFSDDAFNSLENLRKLDLTYNKIASLDRKVFKKLVKLEALGLYGNNIIQMDIHFFGSQKKHLRTLGISWEALTNGNISADDLVRALPNLRFVSFGHEEMPSDPEIVEFCRNLRTKGAGCMVDAEFGISSILGYSPN